MSASPKSLKGALPGPCSICGGCLRYSVPIRRLTCRGCNLDVTLSEQEGREILWHQAAPRLQDVPFGLYLPALLAQHHIFPADVTPEPRVISTKPRPHTHKRRILPVGGETPAERAERLGEQARLNGIGVVPVGWTAAGVPVRFRVDSGERDAHNRPVRRYAVEVSAFRAHCPCQACGLCAHLLAVKDWLVEWEARERPAVAGNSRGAKPPAQVAADGQAAYADLWGD